MCEKKQVQARQGLTRRYNRGMENNDPQTLSQFRSILQKQGCSLSNEDIAEAWEDGLTIEETLDWDDVQKGPDHFKKKFLEGSL